jgi:hypothetical protein
MAISSPKETVYYYECSNGQFRLVYFIPPDKLQELVEQNRISPQVLEDCKRSGGSPPVAI